MNSQAVSVYRCPACYGLLELRGGPGVVESGSLFCPACPAEYPIHFGIPRFIKTEELTGQNARFARLYDRFSFLYAPGARLTYNLFGDKGRRSLLRRLEPLRGKVLEVSIGSGPNLPYFFSRPEVSHVFGLDISQGQLNQCQRYCQKRGWQVELCQGTAEELPYQDNAFDAVFHFGGINFFNDMQKAVLEMIRVAKPGSKIVISDEGEKVAKGYEWTIPNFKRAFEGERTVIKAPIHLVPPEMEDLRLDEMGKGLLYIIEFRKPGHAA